jgi:general secretion pathway protein D
VSPPPFNLNTISQGVNTSDFYLAVPTAAVRFLESDANTKVIAKPQLRGAEGTKLSLALGQSVPVISTAFTPIAGGGAGVNPLASYNYRDVGVTIDMLPRVTVEGDIILDLTLDNSSLAAPILVAGQSVPSFGQRRVTTRLRLRDGESNLLAGLLQESERRSLRGFPGAVNLPILRQLFSANTNEIEQTDIVMLLTPRIIRTSEITQRDLQPIFIGSQGSLGIGGPPPLIAPPPEPAGEPAPGAAAAPPDVITTPQGVRVAPPPGTTPVPGTVVVPPEPQPVPAPAPAPAAPEPVPAPPITSPGVGVAEVFLSSPGVAFRVGGGPYTVPISVTNASRLSTVTLTLTFDPAVLSARGVQEGSFMRSAGVNTTFTQQVSPGRVDITIVRTGDAAGVSGAGLLGAVLFDAIGPGSTQLTPSGTATGPGGTAMGLQFRPVTVTVQQ